MAVEFDPYHRWLGISPKDQPPHHYRLLAIDLFEDDPEVIRDAAEQRMAHVRTYQLGQCSELSQRILNQLAAAKACLSDPQKKAAYDQQLRGRLQETSLDQDLTPQQPAVAPLAQTEPVGAAPPPRPFGGPSPAADESAFSPSERLPAAAARRVLAACAAAWRNLGLFGQIAAGLLVVAGIVVVVGLVGGGSEKRAEERRPAKPAEKGRPEPIPKQTPRTLVFSFDDKAYAEQYWQYSGEWTMAGDGGKAPRGPRSFLRTRHGYQGDLSIDMDFSFGQAQYTNTGGCWITVWDKKLLISNGWHRLRAQVHIHREGDEIVFVLNGQEKRIPVEPDAWSKPTVIEVRWRSRTSHFRRIEIKAQAVVPAS